jgi:hypothetical protein
LLEPERLRRWRLFLFDLVGLVGVVASVYASCGGFLTLLLLRIRPN